MKRIAVHNSFRIAFIIFGACCLIIAITRLSQWIGYKKTDSVVELRKPPPSIKYGTNAYLIVTFMRPSGSIGQVLDIPAGVKPGDRVSVLYLPNGGEGEREGEVVYSFDRVWRIPVYSASVGTASVLLGIYFRRRPGDLFKVSHKSATQHP